jgi:MFS family permease
VAGPGSYAGTRTNDWSYPLIYFTEPRWLALWAALLGFMLDAMDVLLYNLTIQTLRKEFGMDNATAGLVSSFTLIFSAIGGFASGILSDRIGRRKTLVFTVLLYSLASGGTALAQNVPQLIFWRALIGIGLGAEWSAGATLVAESWPAEHRAKALSLMQAGWALGYMLAAAITPPILENYGWRTLFLVGVAPALLTFFIRAKVQEPRVWLERTETADWRGIFRGIYLRRTVLCTALATSVLFAYWGLFSWLPGFLAAPREQGGAGLTIAKTSAWIFIMQSGTFVGYLTFGWLADRFGRRPAFSFYVLMAAILTPIYGLAPRWLGDSAATWLLVIGPLVGFFGTGYFALFGSTLAELYPTPIRGAGQGFSYNFGRALSAAAPYVVGTIGDRQGLGVGLAVSAAFFLAASGLVFLLPETRNTALDGPVAEH